MGLLLRGYGVGSTNSSILLSGLGKAGEAVINVTKVLLKNATFKKEKYKSLPVQFISIKINSLIYNNYFSININNLSIARKVTIYVKSLKYIQNIVINVFKYPFKDNTYKFNFQTNVNPNTITLNTYSPNITLMKHSLNIRTTQKYKNIT